MLTHRRAILPASAAVIALAAAPAAAADGEATASTLHVDGIVTVGQSSADADGGHHTTLSLLGEEVAGGNDDGAVIDTATITGNDEGTPRVTVGQRTANSTSASGSVARIDSGQGHAATVGETSASRDGSAHSTLLVLEGEGHSLRLVESRTAAEEGSTTVGQADGETVLAEQTDDGCAMDMDAAALLCVEGAAATAAAAPVVAAAVVSADGSLGDDLAPAPPAGSPKPGGDDPDPAPKPPTSLPRTGGGGLAALIGLGLTMAGERLRRPVG